MFLETNRRTFLAGLAVTGAGVGSSRNIFAQQATPDDHAEHDHEEEHVDEHGAGDDLYLLVGDTDAKTLTVYNTADNTVIESLEGVVMNGHAGTIPLNDGSVLFVDDAEQRLMHLEVHGDHLHIHEASVPGHVAHIAIESDHAHYCAVGTSSDDDFQLHLVDLETWDVTSVVLPVSGEVGLMLTHDNLFHRNSHLNRVEAYNLESLLNGDVKMLSSVEIGTFGHGEAISESTGELFMLTDDGIDIAYWEDPELIYGKTLAWPEDEPASRGYFARLVADDSHLFTYTADRSAPETEWHTWKNQTVLYDVASGESVISELPDGYVFRYALAEHSASFVVLGADEDSLTTIDLNPESASFGDMISETPLEPMTDGAVPGDYFYDKAAYRAIAISPQGDRVFVSQGGDSRVHVINPSDGTIAATLEHETPLAGGGTLAVFGTAVPTWDTIGR